MVNKINAIYSVSLNIFHSQGGNGKELGATTKRAWHHFPRKGQNHAVHGFVGAPQASMDGRITDAPRPEIRRRMRRIGGERYPFLPTAKKIQADNAVPPNGGAWIVPIIADRRADSPVSGAERSLRPAQRKEMRPNSFDTSL
jgi:hypothetical protein